jgi:hypothetical protein
MGWGTFIAGQTIRSIRRSGSGSGSSSEFFSELLGAHAIWFYRSYRRKVIRGSSVGHPDVQNTVDLNIWEEDIHSRAMKNWRKLLAIQVVVFLIAEVAWWQFVDSDFWIAHFVIYPLFWYYFKPRFIKAHQNSINKELQENGWDTEKLLAELERKLQEKQSLVENKKRIHQQKQASERDKRKYGGA